MTKLKKIFSVALCLAMIFTLPGFAAAQSGDTEQTADSVARVGDRYYDTLKDAANAIDATGTIELVADAEVSGNINIASNKNITLDLGNYTITYDFSGLIKNNGKLTIQAGEEGVIDARQSTTAIETRNGQLTINSGTIMGNMYTIKATDSMIDISGGELSNKSESGNVIYSYKSQTDITGNAKITGANIAVKIMGGDLTISENAYITGKFGVTLFNDIEDNAQDASHAHFNMTGGTIEATYGFALSGNNLSSALCSAEITGGTLRSIDEGTGIYWPMEGELTIGGDAVVEGGTGIEAKMGTITIKDNATITGTGAYLDGKPEGGGAQAEGSAILASAQMYGASEGQYINSPDLIVTITSGTLTGIQGNAVTVYNTEDIEAQTAEVSITGGRLNAADGRAGVQVVMAKGDNETALIQGEESNSFATSKSKTEVTVSSDAAIAAVDRNGQTSYYTNVSDALSSSAATAQNPVSIYVLGDSQVDSEAINSQYVKLITAKGVDLDVNSNVDGMIVRETANEDGSKTYELVDDSELAAPEASLGADKTTVHEGETIILTADVSNSEKGVTYSYAWYKDGKLIEGQDSAVLKVTESGVYSVRITAQKIEDNVVTTSETVESNSVECTVEPHQYTGEWQNDATGHWQLCVCGEKGNTSEHQFGEWAVTKEASATEQGSRERVCSVCGYTQTEVIAATGEETPKTGDDNSALLWIAVMMLAATGAAGCTVYNRKKNN